MFYDRLVTKEDQKWFQAKMSEILKASANLVGGLKRLEENFKKDWKGLVKAFSFKRMLIFYIYVCIFKINLILITISMPKRSSRSSGATS